MSCAPILLFVYNRLEHTKKTIEALKENYLAIESELYIFSDGPKGDDDINDVGVVRNYIRNINGFKKVNVKYQKNNIGLANSIRSGVSEIFKEEKKLIVLEDDLVTSKFFLSFMNEALSFYESDKKVFNISGYNNLKVGPSYIYDVYFAHISTSWGWATWRDRWETIDWNQETYKKITENKSLLKKIESKIGNHRIEMLKRQLSNEIDSWAVLRLFSQIIQNKMTVFPRVTLVKNIGHDGSGVHSQKNSKFDKYNKLFTGDSLKLIKLEESDYINRLVYQKNHVTLIDKVKNKIKRIFLL